jgi:hypothetical protein
LLKAVEREEAMWRMTILAGVLMIFWAASGAAAGSQPAPEHSDGSLGTITLYKDPTCTCCLEYVSYLRSRDYVVTVVVLDEEAMDKKKRDLGIPPSLDSCHTMISAGEKYFIEGHVPTEAMDKLFRQKRDILGIGMAGMPLGAPGMPGIKTEPFAIQQVSREGKVSVFLEM